MKFVQQFFLCMGLFIIIAGFSSHSVWSQENAGPSAQNANQGDQSANTGLGGLFADTIQGILKEGNVFVPNGQTAQPVTSAAGEEHFTLNFNNAQVDQVLKFLSDMTKKVVLKGDDVSGQVSIMSPEEVTPDEALQIIDAAFMLKGFTFIESDQIIIVVPIDQARQRGVDVQVGTGETQLGSRMQTRVISLNHAQPTRLQNAIRDLLSENANVISDDRTRTLVITDTINNINRIEEIITQLDKPDSLQDVVVRIFKLRYLNAREMERNLDDVLENVVSSVLTVQRDDRGRTRANVEVMADRTTNALIIAAPKQAIEMVGEFIKNMDSPAAENIREETFTLRNGDAMEVAQTLSEIARSRRADNYQPVVVADSRTNTVVVSGYQEDIESFRNLITLLDSKDSYEQITRVYPLENADAIILKEMVEMLISPNAASSRNRNYWSGWGRGTDEEVRIVEDQRLNALIVTAKPSQIQMVEDLIEELDQPLPVSKEEPRVYPVENVRANDLAMIINQLFTQQQQTGFFYAQQQQTLTGLMGKVKVISDPTTNSLIVIAGTPRAFDVVESLIKKLDIVSPDLNNTRVFNLKNADADYLQAKLSSLFQGSGNQGGGGGFYWYLNQSMNQEEEISNLIGNVRIESETRTNSLLITTNSQYFPTIENLLLELDKDIQQILIEVLIVEVSDVDDNELGIDWDGEIPLNVQADFNSTLSDITSERATILGRTEFNAVLNFLSYNNKTNVVARPNILTGDNQMAYIEAINRIPITKRISVSNEFVVPEVELEPVGLMLTVQPHINDATTVTINVTLENGQVLEDFGITVQGSTIPALSRRQIRTKLTIHDQETAVLSGVIDTSYISSEKGIPGLMHIPLLGNLFKTKGKNRLRTELMTFITPYILSGIEDREWVFERQKERLRMYEGINDQMDNVDVRFGAVKNN